MTTFCGRFWIIATLVFALTSCASGRYVEVIPNYSRSTLPARESRAAIEDAAAELSAAAGVHIAVRDRPSGFPAERICTLEFAGDEMGKEHAGQMSSDPCHIWLRMEPAGYLSTPEYVHCIALHELGHLFVPPGWHSELPESFMYHAIHQPPCPITRDFFEAMIP